MKKYLLIFACLLGFSMVACSDDDDWESIDFGQLPSQARGFLETYWGGLEISEMEKDGSGSGATYEVTMTNGVEIEFDGNGLWIDVDAPMGMSLPTAFINPGITNYVMLNYPTEGINEISREYYGFEVELTNDVDLYFDNMGDILQNPY